MDFILMSSEHYKRIQPYLMIHVPNISGAIAQIGILQDAFEQFGVL